MQTHGQSVAGNVRAEMARRRVPQTRIAAALGLTQQAVSRRLTGRVAFRSDELAVVARVLGVPAASLLPDEPPAVGRAS